VISCYVATLLQLQSHKDEIAKLRATADAEKFCAVEEVDRLKLEVRRVSDFTIFRLTICYAAALLQLQAQKDASKSVSQQLERISFKVLQLLLLISGVILILLLWAEHLFWLSAYLLHYGF
jgi:hypothetical protein